MTQRLLLLAVGVGCIFVSEPTAAQSATNLMALNSGTTAVLASAKRVINNADYLVEFCGENLPTNHPAISERWTRTINRQAAMAADLTVLKRRASVVFPLIEPILKQYRIPSDFKFLPLLESAVTNRAVSRRGAAGFWQLMPQTAQSLGLSVSHRHDERFNLLKATHAACRYINELYDQLGSWMLVATAYNAGPNYIQQLSRQHPGQHPMALPYRAAETKAYLYQTMAIKELLTHPQAYRSQLSSQHFAALSDNETPVATSERANILASFDVDEATFAKAVSADQLVDSEDVGFVADSTTTVVLLTDDDSADEPVIVESVEREEITPKPTVAAALPTPVPVDRLVTRSMSEGVLTEGQLCIFQVVQPMTINGRAFAVGDVIQAHIEIIDRKLGRVFLRTDQLTTAQTRETVSLKLIATEQPHQPGVALPSRLEDWRLTWESL
jgi:hypothetical protein